MEVVGIGESMVALVNEPSGYIRHADGFKPFLAGAETNTLIGLSRLGHDTGWMSALGEDELGQFILHRARAEGVDTSNVKTKPSRTGVFFKQISPDGSVDVTYYRENSAASRMTVDDIDIESIRKARILYLTGITLSLSESCRKMLFDVVEQVKDDVQVVFDPNIRLKMWSRSEAKSVISDFLPYVDYLLVGKSEVEILLGHDDYEKALAELREQGVGNVIIKLGREGVCYHFHDETGEVDNPKQFDEIDPVGAGDAFAAGVVSGILEGLPSRTVMKQACFLGGYITQFVGDYQGFPSRKNMWAQMNTANEEKVER